jgi:Fur family ferric uptake transcriptional regulator
MDALRAAGFRPTPQRALVVEALHHLGGHVTAEAVQAEVQRSHPYMDLSTVYRTLELLTQLGLVRSFVSASGPNEFELTGEPHHHLVCTVCGSVEPLAAGELAGLESQLIATHGFEPRLAHLAIPGRCRSCRAAGAAPS